MEKDNLNIQVSGVLSGRVPYEVKVDYTELAIDSNMTVGSYVAHVLCKHMREVKGTRVSGKLKDHYKEDTKPVQAIKKTKAKEIVPTAIKTPPVQPLPATKDGECPACEGEGKIQLRTGKRNMQECFKCGGTGKK